MSHWPPYRPAWTACTNITRVPTGETHTCTHTPMRAHTLMQKHRNTHTQTQPHMLEQIHTNTRERTHTHTNTVMQKHRNTHIDAHDL